MHLIYYDLTFGFYDLQEIDNRIKELSKFVSNGDFAKNGKLHKLFEEIGGERQHN